MSGRKTFGLAGAVIKKNTNNSSYLKSITIEKIKFHFNNNDFIFPEFQRELDEIKIKQMVKKMQNDDKLVIFSNQVNPIQLATIQLDDKNFKHLVIDGQHRLNALVLLDNSLDDISFEFHIQLCKDEKDAIKKFKSCIIGQEDNYLISKDNLNEHFRDSKPFQFKKFLIERFPSSFSKSDNHRSYHTIEKFCLELKKRGFFDNNTSLKKLKKIFIRKNNLFLEKEYSFIIEKELSDMLYKDEYKSISEGIIFNLKKSNFIDFLFEDNIKTTHIYRKTKEKIPQKLRNKCWQVHINKNESKCPISFCDEIISNDNFDCSHVISEHNGGKIIISNLIPLCKNCNLSMGTKNIIDFDNDFPTNKFSKIKFKTDKILTK